MLITIGTKNNAKIQGFTNVVKLVWPDTSFITTETKSGIPKQPLSMEEILDGAVNRAHHALKLVKHSDYAAGIEGGVFTNKHGTYLGGWVALLRRDGLLGLGCSAFVEVPEDFAYRLYSGEEMGPIMQRIMNDDKNEIRHSQGTSGILTNGLYDRTKEFEDATRCAVAKFVSPKFYTGEYFRK